MKRLLVLLAVALPAIIAVAQEPFRSIRINEVLASGTLVQSPEGRGYDRVELYNPTASSISIGGLVLGDGSFLTKHKVPEGSEVPAGGFFVINLDPGNTNGNHFNLARGGDTVVFGVEVVVEGIPYIASPIDSIRFGRQAVDMSIGRIPDGSEIVTLLSGMSFGQMNGPAATLGDPTLVRLNEWFAKNEEEFVELYNTGTAPVNLSELTIRDLASTAFQFPALTFIGPQGPNGFQAFEPIEVQGGILPFKLANDDALTLSLLNGTLVDTIQYDNLPNDSSQGRVPDGGANIANFDPTPGAPNFGVITNIIVNELMTHTDLPLEDAIEFYNPTATPVNIGGWYLGGIEPWKENPQGDNFIEKLKKYQFPPNTIVPAFGYLTLYEYQFRNNPLDDNFTFNSAHGGVLYLSRPDAQGNILAYLERSYKPAANGVSFGRITTSDGDVDFTAMAQPSFGSKRPKPFRAGKGAPNTNGVAWGPAIISEIMFAPPDIDGIPGNTNYVDEYVELRNVTKTRLSLFDPNASTNGWKLDGGIKFSFTNTHFIEANGYLLVVSFDPEAEFAQLNSFRSKFGISGDVPIVGPYTGHLGADDTVELYRPDPPQGPTHPDFGFVPQILIDRVHYEEFPWPTNSNRTGTSLQRVNAPSYGDEPLSWRDDAPTAGAVNAHPIVITTQPASHPDLAKANASFTVGVSGSEPQYQWLFKNKPINPKLNASALTDTLILNNISRKNAGAYNCVVTNLANREVSGTGVLEVIDPIVIKIPNPAKPAQVITKPAGTKALNLISKAIGTSPRYQWYKDAQPIENATNSRLTLLSLSNGVSGVYQVIVTNKLSSATSLGITLTVP
ncbi:MAG TPA: lamin tail domain-containing protein [Candidatus Acidoferrum sp.]|nr:lamin tail domain-containing protein [Candidatus Acidoferrum sp.]